ncbi:MAG: flagellar hook-associated protein FlgL [Deltaproteobacteria bacterium]|nr:flagellar hook-associated protein FlgL [Deltaproteobacteria bacterium]
MRVTNRMAYNLIGKGLSQRAERIMRVHESISSGKRVNDLSDDPLALTRILDHRRSLASLDQYTENIDQATSWLKATESSLYDVNKLLARTKELVLGQTTGTATDETRQAVAEEVDRIFEHAIQLADLRLGDRYVFSGFKTDTLPFSSTSDYTYQGDTGSIQVEIARDQKVTINLNGAEVFTSGSINVFSVFDNVVTHLGSNDVSGLQADLADLDTAMDQILGKLAEVGAKANQLESTKQSLLDLKLNITGMVSELEDTDLADAVAELSLQETAYQASLASSVRLMETNLLDFLK